MNRTVLIGIGTGAAICAAGIAYGPTLPLGPEAAALFAGGLGALALMTVAGRHHPASVGLGATALLAIGGYALAARVLVGPAALGALALMAGAALLIGRSLLRGEAPGQRLPGGDSA
ncbi:MAG: hypothetical protein QMD46_06755 [Methanomicrobiales archaeon]|nr:hypothetical protein [Methanomicrobiales archaeon]